MSAIFLLLFLASIVLLIIGVFNPTKSLFWYKRTRTKKKSFLIYFGLTIMCFILFGVSTDSEISSKSNNEVQTESSTVEEGNSKKVKTEELSTISESGSSGDMDLSTKIKNNIKSIEGGDDLTENEMKSAQEFTITAAIFKAYAVTINEGKASTDKEVLKLTDELEKKVIISQLKNFPKIRKAYYVFIKNTLWENDVDVSLSGKNNTVLKLTGGYFAANKNIKTSQEALYDMLVLLRFKQTQYRWYKSQDDFTYYDIESSKDSEISE